MTGYRRTLICWLTTVTILFGSALCRAESEYEYIDISNPFLRKIPIAVPLFKTTSASLQEEQVSVQGSDLISKSLEFTGYFKMLDPGAFLENPQKSGIITSSINFQNWTGIGAEILVTGGVSIKGNLLEMELRLIDTFKAQLLVGKQYKGWIHDPRRMLHRFCNEVVYRLTGSWGVFDSKIAFSTPSRVESLIMEDTHSGRFFFSSVVSHCCSFSLYSWYC